MEKEFPWVKSDEEKKEMFCIVCLKYPTVADANFRFVNGRCHF